MDEWQKLHESVDDLKQELKKEWEPFFLQLINIFSRVINGITKMLF